MKEIFYRIMKVSNGWIFEPYNPEYGPIMNRGETYVFTSSKKLAKFIEKLDENPKEA